MSKIKTIFKNPPIQISFASGVSILVLAYFSKRALSEPLSYLSLSAPPFITTIYESLLPKNKKYLRKWLWKIE